MRLTILRLAAILWSLASTTLLLVILLAGHDGDVLVTTNEYGEQWVELGLFGLVWIGLLGLSIHDYRAFVRRERIG